MVGEENPFIRFKNHIDNNVRRAFDSVVGSFQVSPSSKPSASSTASSHPDSSDTLTTNQPSSPPPPPSSSASPSSSSPPPSSSSSSSSSSFNMAPPSSSSNTTSSNTGESESEHQHTTAITSPTTQATADVPAIMDADDVHDWAVQSPYSPLNLQDLPQPVPRDVPADWDDLPFTFRDAFEELLVAGSGFPLRNGRELALRKATTGAALTFPLSYSSEERHGLHVAHWVDQLGLLGLWDAYFNLKQRERWDVTPRRPGFGFSAGVGAGAGAGSSLTLGQTAGTDRMYFRSPARQRRAAHGGQEEEREDQYANPFPHSRRWGFDGLWDTVWRFGLERDARWEGTPSTRRRQDNNNNRYIDDDDDDNDDDDDYDNGDEGQDADVEDELYAPRRASGAAPISSQPNNHHYHSLPRPPPPPPPSWRGPSPSPEVTTRVYPDGSRTVTAVERRQRGGKTEITTSRQHFGPDGVLVFERRETSTTRTWSGHLPGAQASMSWSFNSNSASSSREESSGGAVGEGERDKARGDGDGDDKGDDGKDGKNGWFWRR